MNLTRRHGEPSLMSMRGLIRATLREHGHTETPNLLADPVGAREPRRAVRVRLAPHSLPAVPRGSALHSIHGEAGGPDRLDDGPVTQRGPGVVHEFDSIIL